jgi:hypothetical protein
MFRPKPGLNLETLGIQEISRACVLGFDYSSYFSTHVCTSQIKAAYMHVSVSSNLHCHQPNLKDKRCETHEIKFKCSNQCTTFFFHLTIHLFYFFYK